MKSYDEIYQSVLRRRDEQMAKKRRRIAVAGSVVLPAIMLSAAVGIGVAAWQGGPAAELPSAQDSQFESVDIEVADGKAVVAKCSLGGYTAELELTDITHEPATGENYFSTNSLSIKVTDPDGNVAESVLDNYVSEELWIADYAPVGLNGNGYVHAWYEFLNKLSVEHIGESLKLYELDDNGTKHYALALRVREPYTWGYDFDLPIYTTLFFSCEPYSFDSGVLYMYGWVSEEHESGFEHYNSPDGRSTYTAGTSDNMTISGMTIINDGEVDAGYWAPMVYKFDPENCSFIADQVPQLGGDINISSDEVDGYTAHLRLKGLTHVPEWGEDYYTAEGAEVIVVNTKDQTKATVSLENTAITNQYFVKDIQWESNNLWGTEVKGGVKLLPIEFEGERHYVLAVQHYYKQEGFYAGTEQDYIDPDPVNITAFYACEPDCFETGILYSYDEQPHRGQFVYSVAEDFRLSEGNTYIWGDSNEWYVRFDPVNRTTVNGSVTSVLAYDSIDEYSVTYEMKYVTHIASFNGGPASDQPNGYEAGEDAIIRVTGKDGSSCEISLNSCGNSMAADDFVKNLRGDEDASFYYCVKMLKLNDNGTDRYVIMLRNYLEDNEGYSRYATALFSFDPETFTITSIAPSDADHYLFVTTDHMNIENRDGSDIIVCEELPFTYEIEFDHANNHFTYSILTPEDRENAAEEETAAESEETVPEYEGAAPESEETAPEYEETVSADEEVTPDETELPA